jgi:SapC protein
MAELLFYQKPARLNSAAHGKLRFTPLSTFDFASKVSSIPIIAAEFPVACRQYPLVFVEGPTGLLSAQAVLSFEKDRNAFLDPKGNWTATYVPAFIRRYPFVLAEIPGKTEDFDVAFDEGSGCFDKKKGEALFDDQGAPTKFLQEQIDFLRLFHVEFKRTQQFLDTLKQEDLLSPYNVDIVRGGDNARFAVRSAMVINESKLHSLPAEKALAYLKNGFLGLMYAQLISLQSFLALANRTSDEAATKTPWWAK